VAEEMTYKRALATLAGLTPDQLASHLKAWAEYGNPDQKTAVKNWKAGIRPGDKTEQSPPDSVIATWNRQHRAWTRQVSEHADEVARAFREAPEQSLPWLALESLAGDYREDIRSASLFQMAPGDVRRAARAALDALQGEIATLELRLNLAERRRDLADTVAEFGRLIPQGQRYLMYIDLETASTSNVIGLRDTFDALEQAVTHAQQDRLDRQLQSLPRHTGPRGPNNRRRR